MEVLGVAEAWVLGGDQGQPGEAGKMDSLQIHFILGCRYQFCGSGIIAAPGFSQSRYLSNECAVRERVDNGPVECGYGHWGGLPRLKSRRTLPSQVRECCD